VPRTAVMAGISVAQPMDSREAKPTSNEALGKKNQKDLVGICELASNQAYKPNQI
jgi:hypothetical protein